MSENISNLDRISAYSKLINHIESLNLIESNKIDLNTTVEKDLGLTGDDAINFIEEFAEVFQINIESFEYDKYFGSEGWVFRKRVRADVALSKLLDAILLGKLD